MPTVNEWLTGIMGILIPVSTSIVASASVYFVLMKIGFPLEGGIINASNFALFIFAVTLYKHWGDTDVLEEV